LKNVGIPENYFCRNLEFLGGSWKNQGFLLAISEETYNQNVVPKLEFLWGLLKNQKLGFTISSRTYIKNVIPKFESIFGEAMKPIKIPMSELYHPDIVDTLMCTEEYSAEYGWKELPPFVFENFHECTRFILFMMQVYINFTLNFF
jgi:hypothetical protein